jgi:methylmalonyl-CoA/ethylmalonyl-CoA epimerase
MVSIAHIGVIVADLEKGVEKFSALLGGSPRHIEEMPKQNVRIAVFSSASQESPDIELITPIAKSGGLQKFLEKRGEGVHHIAIRVVDIDERLSDLKAKGFRLIDERARIGAEGKRVAFIHPASCGGVLIELVEDGGAGARQT